jgi:uncharacterized membrane protein YidH (DUF202 family)
VATEVKNSNELAVERTDLAVFRTYLAVRRTMMGWTRTGLSLIGFGFTIYKILKAAVAAGAMPMLQEQGPRRFGLLLIGLGTGCAITGVAEFVRTVRLLNRESSKEYRIFDFGVILGALIALLGLILMGGVLANREMF